MLFTELYKQRKQERKGAEGGGKGEIQHFPSALPKKRQGRETEELPANHSKPDKCKWTTKRTNTWRSAKGKPAHRGKTKRIHRKGKEDVGRLFWWDKILRKQPTHTTTLRIKHKHLKVWRQHHNTEEKRFCLRKKTRYWKPQQDKKC